MEKLVSILTPCFNGEKYIDRYAQSLLSQDYSNCQVIFMDDGSTDNTKELIFEYKDRFEKKGFSFEYHYHDNIGPGGTIAEGIRFVKGDYLVWPDVDDEMTSDSISKKVRFLEGNKQFGIVRTDFLRVFTKDGEVLEERGAQKYQNRFKSDLFMDYLLNNQAWFQPGCFMVDMKAFLAANPDRYIFPTRRGQNWQMLLPVFYRFKCGYIDEPLYKYNIYSGSLSNPKKTDYGSELSKIEKFNELIVETLIHMKIEDAEKQKYITMVNNKYLKEKLALAFRFFEKREAQKYYRLLKEEGHVTIKDYLKTKGVVMWVFRVIRKF